MLTGLDLTRILNSVLMVYLNDAFYHTRRLNHGKVDKENGKIGKHDNEDKRIWM